MTYRERHRIKAASERGRRMAAARWRNDRARRNRLAQLSAEFFQRRIKRRIIVIDDEQIVREAVIWTWDSYRTARSKLLAVLRVPNIGAAQQHSPTKKT